MAERGGMHFGAGVSQFPALHVPRSKVPRLVETDVPGVWLHVYPQRRKRGPKALARRRLRKEHRALRAGGLTLSLRAWLKGRGHG